MQIVKVCNKMLIYAYFHGNRFIFYGLVFIMCYNNSILKMLLKEGLLI